MTTALEGVSGQRHAPADLYPLERPGTHCTGGWVGPRVGLDRCGKSRPTPGFDPRTVQSVASRCTDLVTRNADRVTDNEAISLLVPYSNSFISFAGCNYLHFPIFRYF